MIGKDLLLIKKYIKPYKLKIVTISVLAIICAFFEAINLGSLVPLLQMMTNESDPGGTLWSILNIVFTFIGIPLNFPNLLAVMSVLFVIGQVLLFVKKRMQVNVWFGFSSDLKKIIFKNILHTDIEYHYTENRGKFIDILMRESEYAATSVFVVTEIFTYIFFIIVYSVMLLYISIELTALCILVAVLSFYLLSRMLITKSKDYGNQCVEVGITLNEFISERLQLLKLIRIFSTESREEKKLAEIVAGYARNSSSFMMNGVKIETYFQIIIFSIAVMIIYSSIMVFHLMLPLLFVFIFILLRLTDPLRQINGRRHELAGEVASLEKIDQILGQMQEAKTIRDGRLQFPGFNRDITFNKVCFSYRENLPVLKDLSFTIRKNEMIALVGASGGGKSTIVDLLVRLIEPDSGSICIDGINIKEFTLESYHKRLGFVSQDTFIFNDSVVNNIGYGYDEILMDEVIEAAKLANAHEFISKLPKGYETILGEQGVTLSGGQKQRIALARALFRQPDILILDEATSALDSESESKIQQSIRTIKHRFTIAIIAHRLSTIENADRIMLIETGEIQETGTQKSLMNSDGMYKRLHNIQYGKAGEPE